MSESPKIAKPFLMIALPLAVACVVLIFVGLEVQRYLATSSRFEIKNIVLETKGPAKRNEILESVGVLKGINLFALDLDEVKARVETNPWVERAIVSRVLPDTVTIQYEAQKPRAILNMDSMYYINGDGVPFYKVEKGDSLDYSMIHLEKIAGPKDVPVGGVRSALELIDYAQKSSFFVLDDIGQITVRGSAYNGGAPLVVTVAFPPVKLRGKGGAKHHFFPVTLAEGNIPQQLRRVEAVMQHLVQAGKNPRLIRSELGKKIVVKIAP